MKQTYIILERKKGLGTRCVYCHVRREREGTKENGSGKKSTSTSSLSAIICGAVLLEVARASPPRLTLSAKEGDGAVGRPLETATIGTNDRGWDGMGWEWEAKGAEIKQGKKDTIIQSGK